jgi:hypothetical protein
MVDDQGGECLSKVHCLGTWQMHFDDKSLQTMGHNFAGLVFLKIAQTPQT